MKRIFLIFFLNIKGMVFKNIIFLYLIPLSLLPVLLHLLFIKFLKTLPFPWLGFLERKEDERRKRRKIREILILISRVLFLFFLLIFLSSPFLKRKFYPDLVIQDISESTLIYKDLFEKKMNKISKIIGEDKIKKEKYLDTKDKKGTIFVITDGDLNFFKNIKYSEENFLIFVPFEERNDIGIYDAEIKGENIFIKIYSTKKVSEANLKILFDDIPFSFTFEIKEGLNDYVFPLKIKDFEFLKIQVLPNDFLLENNFYFISKPKVFKYYKSFGQISKYLKNLLDVLGYKELKGISDSVIFIFYGVPEEKEEFNVLLNFINSEKPCILFLDKDFLNTELKKDINIKIGEDIVHFSKIFDIKEGRVIFDYKGICYVSLLKNTLIFGFLPETFYTDIVYLPSFLKIFKEGINYLKLDLPYSIYLKRDTFIYLDEKEIRIYDSERNFVKKEEIKEGKIFFNDLNYGSYVIQNKRKIYININFPKEEIGIKKVKEEEIKDLLVNSKIYSLEEIDKFLPIPLKNVSISLSIFFLIIEILLISLL